MELFKDVKRFLWTDSSWWGDRGYQIPQQGTINIMTVYYNFLCHSQATYVRSEIGAQARAISVIIFV